MKYLPFCLLIFLASLSSCQETQDLVLDPPLSKVVGISDTWRLTQIVQVDFLTKIPERRERDITTLAIGANPMTVSFTTDGNYSLNAGSSLNYLGAESGTWAFNNNDYPTLINISANGINSELSLYGPTREIDSYLKVGVQRYCNIPDDNGVPQATPTLGYVYIFERQ